MIQDDNSGSASKEHKKDEKKSAQCIRNDRHVVTISIDSPRTVVLDCTA